QPVDLDSPDQLGELLGLTVERFRRDTGINARFISDANTAALPMRTAIEVVRIVQEGLVNVRKHSAARTVIVRLRQRDSEWTVTIEDDGRGFEFTGQVTGADLNARVLGPSVIAQRALA